MLGNENAGTGSSSPSSTKSASKSSLKRSESRVVRKESKSNHVPSPESQSHELGIQNLEARVSELEKEIGCINEKLDSDPMRSLGANGTGGVEDLVAKIQTMKADMEKMNGLASRLMDEKENRESHTNVKSLETYLHGVKIDHSAQNYKRNLSRCFLWFRL